MRRQDLILRLHFIVYVLARLCDKSRHEWGWG